MIFDLIDVISGEVKQPGVYVSEALWVPRDATHVTVRAESRSEWVQFGVDETVVELSIEVNKGGMWELLGGCETDAQEVRGRDGNVLSGTVLRVRVPQQSIPVPQVRVVLRCASPCSGVVSAQFDDAPLPVRREVEHHSVTYDSDNEAVGAAITTLTIGAFTVANNANRCMVVGIVNYHATVGNAVISSITHDGVTTGWSAAISVADSTATTRAHIWRKVAPSAINGTVAVTAAGVCSEFGANATSLYDVDQTTPIGDTDFDEGTAEAPQTATITLTAAANDMVYDVIYEYAGLSSARAAGAGQTERANGVVVTYGGARTSFGASTEPGAATVTMSWSLTNGDETYWLHPGVVVKVNASAAATSLATSPFLFNHLLVR